MDKKTNYDVTEHGSQHITPANGNIFLDLGFEPEEAARLLAESDKEIMAKRARAVSQTSAKVLLDVVKVRAGQDYRLHIEFENGENRVFDMTPYLDKRPYVSLKDKALFDMVSIDYGTAVWPGNIDIAPETLYGQSVPE